MKVSRDEVTRLMSAFEQENPIADYVCFDWNVWPLLRVQVAYEAMVKVLNKSGDTTPHRSIKSAGDRYLPTKILRKLLHRLPLISKKTLSSSSLIVDDGFGDQHPSVCKGDVVLFTLSSRRIKLNGCNYEIYTDPIVSKLKFLGVASLVWERGLAVVPRYSQSFWIDRPLQTALANKEALPPLPEPSWFKNFVPLAESLLERELSWGEVEGKIRQLQQTSLVFEDWLKTSEAKMLVSVCWYDPIIMAATLAAKRLSLISVDLQHGVQDEAHFAYRRWNRSPINGYELVPRVFWNWGNRQVANLKENNPAFETSSFIAGGNSWLNVWKDQKNIVLFDVVGAYAASSYDLAQYRKIILVTLQSAGTYADTVFARVENSDTNWLWLIRFHPATAQEELERVKAKLFTVPKSRVEFDLASRLPLYALLKICNVHVTGFSTCALEALAFGKPTIIVSQDGVDSYGDYIKAGVMAFAQDGEELVKMISDFIPSPLQCELAAQADFASPLQSSQAFIDLLDMAGVRIISAPDKEF